MADTKISALPQYPNASLLGSDLLVVVSATSGTLTTYKANVSQLQPTAVVYGDFILTTTGLNSSAWFNYPASFTFSTALANAQAAAATPIPNYSVTFTSGATTITGNTTVPTVSPQNVSLPALASPTYPVTVGLSVTATMTNSDSTTSVKTKTASASYYVPLFYKVTANSANPNFATTDTQGTSQYASGQTASQTITAQTQYFWIAIPTANPVTFTVVTIPNFPVSITPDATFTNQTIGSITGWSVYGFTNLTSRLQTIQVT